MAELGQRVEWSEIVDVVRTLLNSVVVRSQYPEQHPAIARADQNALAHLGRVLERAPELVVALAEGEFIVMERPLPELRRRAPGFAEAMQRQGIECLVFLRGIGADEVAALARGLGSPAVSDEEAPAMRDRLQALLQHVLLRFVEIKTQDPTKATAVQNAALIEPRVRGLLEHARDWIAQGAKFDLDEVRDAADHVLQCVRARTYGLAMHSWGEGVDLSAGHSANVAMIAGAMAHEGGLRTEACLDIVAGALLHDVGHYLLPAPIRWTPEPLLDEKARRFHRYHPFLGARALFEGGCPPLWTAIALEHHRGVDGDGFPELDDKAPPHEASRIVTVANFFDRKRISLKQEADPPEVVLAQMRKLAGRYLDPKLVDLFLRAMGVFPPGTSVELSDRRSAVVTRASPSEPLRPEVRLLFGGDTEVRLSLMDYEVKERRHVTSIVRATAPPIVALPRHEADAILAEIAAAASAAKKPSSHYTTDPTIVRAPPAASRGGSKRPSKAPVSQRSSQPAPSRPERAARTSSSASKPAPKSPPSSPSPKPARSSPAPARSSPAPARSSPPPARSSPAPARSSPAPARSSSPPPQSAPPERAPTLSRRPTPTPRAAQSPSAAPKRRNTSPGMGAVSPSPSISPKISTAPEIEGPKPSRAPEGAPRSERSDRSSLGPPLSMEPPPANAPSMRPRYKPIPREDPDEEK